MLIANLAPQVALFIVFAIVKFIVWVCKNASPSTPTRFRTRTRTVEPVPIYSGSSDRISQRVEDFKTKSGLHRIANNLRGEVDLSTTVPSIKFVANGSHYRAYISHQHGAHSIRLISFWPDEKFRMRVFPDQSRTKSWKSFKHLKHDIETGYSRFDRDFVVQGNQEDAIRDLLKPKICERIARHTKSAHGRISLTVSGSEIEFGGKATRLLSNIQVTSIIRNFTHIHRLMLDAYGTIEIQGADLKFVEKSESKCMVCGDQVGSAGVECQVCGTRHHRDCWSYIGKCSTYGCHSRRAE